MRGAPGLIAMALVLLLSAGACSTDALTGDGRQVMKIGLITKFPGPFYETIIEGAKDYAAVHPDIQLVFGQSASGTDDAGQSDIIDRMVADRVNAIAITPTSPNVQPALDRAVAAGVKVVLVDNDIPGWRGKTAVVATDNRAGGMLAGAWLGEHLPAGATIAILQGRVGNPSLDDRVTGMKIALAGRATVVAEPATDCDQAKGLAATRELLLAHPAISAIYGACGPPTVGALQAIKNAGKAFTNIVVVGFDASPDEVAAIAAGKEAVSVAQFPSQMGTLGIQTALVAARGNTVKTNVDTGSELVTTENVGLFQ